MCVCTHERSVPSLMTTNKQTFFDAAVTFDPAREGRALVVGKEGRKKNNSYFNPPTARPFALQSRFFESCVYYLAFLLLRCFLLLLGSFARERERKRVFSIFFVSKRNKLKSSFSLFFSVSSKSKNASRPRYVERRGRRRRGPRRSRESPAPDRGRRAGGVPPRGQVGRYEGKIDSFTGIVSIDDGEKLNLDEEENQLANDHPQATAASSRRAKRTRAGVKSSGTRTNRSKRSTSPRRPWRPCAPGSRRCGALPSRPRSRRRGRWGKLKDRDRKREQLAPLLLLPLLLLPLLPLLLPQTPRTLLRSSA